MTKDRLFDDWAESYDRWFETPIGSAVKACEQNLVLDFLQPNRGETIVDAGCGTGVFTLAMLSAGARIFGLDLSFPMLQKAVKKCSFLPFAGVAGDIMSLPFPDESFDKAVSVTALEFIHDARTCVDELFRVTKRGGLVVVATLNSLSPWAERRRQKAGRQKTIFSTAIFRSPDELLSLAPVQGIVKTAVHFPADADPETAIATERAGRKKGLQTGAFVAARWRKP